jgi:divalent metal cation (Fe/Co/Zn/Cd) transporter
VLKTGWQLLSDSMRMLLDASLDPETLAKARTIIEEQPGVVNVNSLTGRNAGRYRFLETEVALNLETALTEWQTGDSMVTIPTWRPDQGEQPDGSQGQVGPK